MVPWPRRRRTLDAYSCRARPCRQVAIRASDAHATPQTRADSASAWYSHSRAKSRLAARKRGTCQFMKSRSGALAKPRDAPVAAPLPAIAAARNTPGWHSVRAGRRCARIHAPGWRGRRRPTAAPAAAARATARCACRPRAADAAGCWHCIRCSGRPRPAPRAHLGAHLFDPRNSAERVRGREEQAVSPGGRDEKGRRSIAQPATGRAPAPRRPRPARRAAPHTATAAPCPAPVPRRPALRRPAAAGTTASIRPARRAMPTARPAAGPRR